MSSDILISILSAMKRRALLLGACGASLLLSFPFANGQPVQQVLPQPDCQFFFTLTTATSAPVAGFNNLQQGCATWAISYTSTGFAGLTVTLQSAANNNGAASTFGAGFPVQQNTVSGSNAMTSTVGGFWWVQGTNAFVRAALSGLTGTGTVNGVVSGWRIPSAGGSGGGSGAIACLTGDVTAGSGSGCTAASVVGINSVPLCTGFAPSNGQVIAYTTASSPNPCWTTAANGGGGGGGSFVLLEEHTASTTLALNFTNWYSATYDNYEIDVINWVPTTSGDYPILQVSTNGGSSYQSSSYQYSILFTGANEDTGVQGSTSIPNIVLGDTTGASGNSTPGVGWIIRMYNSGGSFPTFMSGVGSYHNNSTGEYYSMTLNGVWGGSSAVNAFRITCQNQSDTIASGTVRIYGLTH